MTYNQIKSGVEVIYLNSKFLLVNKVDNSYSKVIVMDISRGKGWSESLQRYVGVRSKYGWARCENYNYGVEVVVHIKDVELLN